MRRAVAATRQAIEMIFSANIGSQVAGLQQEKQQAVESGDKEKVAEIDRQVEQLRQFEELVKLNTSIVEEKAKLEELKVRIEEQAEAARKTAEAAEAGKQELADLKAKIIERWGNSDATRPVTVRLATSSVKLALSPNPVPVPVTVMS